MLPKSPPCHNYTRAGQPPERRIIGADEIIRSLGACWEREGMTETWSSLLLEESSWVLWNHCTARCLMWSPHSCFYSWHLIAWGLIVIFTMYDCWSMMLLKENTQSSVRLTEVGLFVDIHYDTDYKREWSWFSALCNGDAGSQVLSWIMQRTWNDTNKSSVWTWNTETILPEEWT